MTKKKIIFAVPLIYLNYTIDDSLKTVVLIVNLNLYCSSEAPEVRENRLYRMCLTSVNYGHCGFRAR